MIAIKIAVLVFLCIVFAGVVLTLWEIVCTRKDIRELEERMNELGSDHRLLNDADEKEKIKWVEDLLGRVLPGLAIGILMMALFSSCSQTGRMRHYQRIHGLKETGHYKIQKIVKENTVRFKGVAGQYFFPTDSIPKDSIVHITIIRIK